MRPFLSHFHCTSFAFVLFYSKIILSLLLLLLDHQRAQESNSIHMNFTQI